MTFSVATRSKFIGAAIVLAILAAPAEAKIRKHHKYKSHKSQIVRIADVPTCASDDRYPCASYSVAAPNRVNSGSSSAKRQAPAVSYSVSGIVATARAHIGKNAAQLGLRRDRWCAAFLNKITGGGTGSDPAASWASKPKTSYGCVGCVAVMSRKGGGHVGIVSGYDKNGDPILISGNHRKRVAESKYPKGRIYAYVVAE